MTFKIKGEGMRAYQLQNGDVFTINTKDGWMTLMFNNNTFYEVVEDSNSGFEIIDGIQINMGYSKTGREFTGEELSKIVGEV